MAIIDLIFDWSKIIVSVFADICEWFVTPIDFGINFPGDDLFFADSGSLIDKVMEMFGLDTSPISLLLGPGLVIVLSYTFLKWVLDIVL